MRARAVAKQQRMIAIAGQAEGAAGYACRFLSFEQLARKVCGTQPGGLDAREGVILIAAGMSEAMDLANVKKSRMPKRGMADTAWRTNCCGSKATKPLQRRFMTAATVVLPGGVQFKASHRSNDRGPSTSSLVF
jgi:hypothetical protein